MQTTLFNRPQWVRKPIEHSIYTGTPLLPYIIAGRVTHDVILPDMTGEKQAEVLTALNNALEDRAEKCYQHSPHFREALNNKKTDCRKVLEMFMHHWLKSELKKITKN